MGYLREALVDGERVVYQARFHWFYTVSALSWLVLSAAFSLWLYSAPPESWVGALRFSLIPALGQWGRVDRMLSILVFLVGAYRYLAMTWVQFGTEIAVTDRRLIHKRGVIARHASSVSLRAVESAEVLQGVLGRLLGFGRVLVRGTGTGTIVFPELDDPLTLRKAVLEASHALR